jgi:hypothetical protein
MSALLFSSHTTADHGGLQSCGGRRDCVKLTPWSLQSDPFRLLAMATCPFWQIVDLPVRQEKSVRPAPNSKDGHLALCKSSVDSRPPQPGHQFFLSLLVLVRQMAMSLKKLPGIVTFVLNSTQHSGNFN